jgi:hypothetical protein
MTGHIQHYLLTVALDAATNMHCYIMCDDRRYVMAAADKLLSEAEKLGGRPLPLPMMLATPIPPDDVSLVRAVLSARSADVARLLQEATDFHWAFFTTCASDADDARLLAVH